MKTAAVLLALSAMASAEQVGQCLVDDPHCLITSAEYAGFNPAAASYFVTAANAHKSYDISSIGRPPADEAAGPAWISFQLEHLSSFPPDQRSAFSDFANHLLEFQNVATGTGNAAVTSGAASAVSTGAQASATAVSGPAATATDAGSQPGASSGFVTSAPAATDASGAAAPQTDASGATVSAAAGASGTQSVASGGASKPTDVAYMAMAGAVVGVAGLVMGL